MSIEAIYNWLNCIMCHSNNVVIYRVVFGPERMTYSVKESYYWSYLQLTKVYNVPQ